MRSMFVTSYVSEKFMQRGRKKSKTFNDKIAYLFVS